jgi:hypothetical protein
MHVGSPVVGVTVGLPGIGVGSSEGASVGNAVVGR